MSPPGGMTATMQAPTYQTVRPGESGTPLADFVAAAQVLCLRGWSEKAAIAALETYRAQGIRGLTRQVSRMSPEKDRLYREHFTREARAHRRNRRGDLITLRSAPRWPWRTDSSQ